MKTLLKSAVLLLGMGLLSTHSQAQKVVVEDKEPNSVMFVTIDKAGNEIIRIMNASQSPRFHEPKAPRFLLTDRKGKFALGIGGYVKLAAEYDFGGISDNIDFYPALIPGRGQSYVRNQFQMDATTSTIFLKLVGHTDLLGDFVVYTAGNFRGGSGKIFELRNAYVSARGFTAGYDYGSFMDLGNVPATIDFAGPNGMSIYHATQIRYEHALAKGLKAGIGVEMPVVDGLTNEHVSIAKQRMPNFPVYVQYGWNPIYEDISLAYATTIHKFQGSEGDIMVIVLPSDIAPSMISRSILYTAETRAIEKVIILSSENMLERFIKAEMHQKRNSGIITKLDNLC